MLLFYFKAMAYWLILVLRSLINIYCNLEGPFGPNINIGTSLAHLSAIKKPTSLSIVKSSHPMWARARVHTHVHVPSPLSPWAGLPWLLWTQNHPDFSTKNSLRNVKASADKQTNSKLLTTNNIYTIRGLPVEPQPSGAGTFEWLLSFLSASGATCSRANPPPPQRGQLRQEELARIESNAASTQAR